MASVVVVESAPQNPSGIWQGRRRSAPCRRAAARRTSFRKLAIRRSSRLCSVEAPVGTAA
eukprot:6186927-Pleurochrysis_carterae.AAC.1